MYEVTCYHKSLGMFRGLSSFRRFLSTDRIVRSPLPDAQIPLATVHDFVYRHFDRYGDRTAIVDALTGQSYTYAQLGATTDRFASSLRRRGFNKGDALCIFLPNVPDYPIVYFGTTKAGGVATTANPTYTSRELAYQLRDSKSKFLVTLPAFADVAKAAANEAGTVEETIVVDTLSPGHVPSNTIGLSEFLNTDPVAATWPSTGAANLKEDVATLPYSSGTTGLPKGVMLSHYNLVANICQLVADRRLLQVTETDRVCMSLLPFFHIYGMIVTLARGLQQGSTLVTLPKFEPEPFLKALQDHRVTMLPLVPPLALFLAKHPDVGNYDLSNVVDIMSGAAPLSGDVTTTLYKRLGTECVRQGYGLTETSPVTHMCLRDQTRSGSVGFSVPNTETKVIGAETGEALGALDEGEICIRGPQVMLGYLNNPEATARTIDADGWLHTGDIGYHDKDEFLYVTDRLKELIKVKGFQVRSDPRPRLLCAHIDYVF